MRHLTVTFLQVQIHQPQYALKQVHNLYQADAPIAVNIKYRLRKPEGFHKERINIAGVRRKKHLPRQSADKARQHKRHKEQALHKSFVRQVGTGNKPRKKRAYNRTANCRHAGDNQRVFQCLKSFRLCQYSVKVTAVKSAVNKKGVKQN